MTATAWPADVVARYRTVGGSTVDLTDDGHHATCLGCGRQENSSYSLHIHQWAQAHAETCRALPRPDSKEEK